MPVLRAVPMAFRAHRFATGLPCRASSHAACAMLASLRVAGGRGCGSRPSGRASLARVPAKATGIEFRDPEDPGCRSQCPIADTGDREAAGSRGQLPRALSMPQARHAMKSRGRDPPPRGRGHAIHPTGQCPHQPSLCSAHPRGCIPPSVTRNHGKSAPARVNPQRRPGCWQPDSHGRWRSLRIGAAARPAPLAASRG